MNATALVGKLGFVTKLAYEELLCKNHDVFSTSPEDLGKASHFQHTIELNRYEPVYERH